jgi:hypothetical protein
MLLLGDKPSNCEKDGTLFTINKVSITNSCIKWRKKQKKKSCERKTIEKRQRNEENLLDELKSKNDGKPHKKT